MAAKYILFVDDEKAQQGFFETAVTDWNGKNTERQRNFQYELADTFEEAQVLLNRRRYDCALFDLRVRSKDQRAKSADPNGNILALSALKERGIPVGIMTADDTVLDDAVKDAGKVKIFDKNSDEDALASPYDAAVEWFSEQWEMMDALADARKRIDSSVADVFLRRLWPRWSSLSDLNIADSSQLNSIVTRQFVTHLAELLGIDGVENAHWHPYENYTHPAVLEDRANTGDIFEIDGRLMVVLTPQCDMATQKVDSVILGLCVPGIPDWDDMSKKLRDREKQKFIDQATRFFRRHVNQDLESSRHFLPPLPGRNEPILVHFSSISTMPMDTINASLAKRVASIAPPFLSNLVQRFGSYISRTGQPNLDITHL
jgi:CheY-like chemotaxis protein